MFSFNFYFTLTFQSITLQDTKVATMYDLGTQFFLREEDVQEKKNRSICKD